MLEYSSLCNKTGIIGPVSRGLCMGTLLCKPVGEGGESDLGAVQFNWLKCEYILSTAHPLGSVDLCRASALICAFGNS